MNNAAGMTQPLAFLPVTERDFLKPPAGGTTAVARSNSAADALNTVNRTVASLDPNLLTPFNAQTLSEYLDLSRYAYARLFAPSDASACSDCCYRQSDSPT